MKFFYICKLNRKLIHICVGHFWDKLVDHVNGRRKEKTQGNQRMVIFMGASAPECCHEAVAELDEDSSERRFARSALLAEYL